MYLLLLDGVSQIDAIAAPLSIGLLQEFPGAEGVSVHLQHPLGFERARDGLYDSARSGSTLAYQLLTGEGIVRGQLWVRYDLIGHVNVVGESASLLFALALMTQKWGGRAPSAPLIAATGVLGEHGEVHAVQGIASKLTALEYAAQHAACNIFVFYPQANDSEVATWRTQRTLPETIQFFAVDQIEQALERLGIRLQRAFLKNPFRALESFDYDQRAIFFGREREVRALVEIGLRREHLGCPGIVIIGPSGIGKSSLVKAGLLPALAEPALIMDATLLQRPVPIDQHHVVWRPSEVTVGDDEAILAESIWRTWQRGDGFRSVLGAADPTRFEDLLQLYDEHWDASTRFVWLIDQLEELFSPTVQHSSKTLNALGNFLLGLRGRGTWTIASLRDDFLPQFSREASLREVFDGPEGFYYLQRVRESALDDIITRPARVAGLVFEFDRQSGRSLEAEIKEAVRAQAAVLPLLEFTLASLYQRRQKNLLTLAVYDAIGGLRGAIASVADEVLLQERFSSTEALSMALRCLVRVDLDGNAERRRATVSEVEHDANTNALIGCLIEKRLCVVEISQDGPTYAFAHDALISYWPRVSVWLKDQRSLLQARDRIERDAHVWRQRGESRGLLATAPEKIADIRLVRDVKTPLAPNVEHFANLSLKAERKNTWLKRAAMAGMMFLTVAALAMAFIASKQQQRASLAAATVEAENALYLITQGRTEAALVAASHAYRTLKPVKMRADELALNRVVLSRALASSLAVRLPAEVMRNFGVSEAHRRIITSRKGRPLNVWSFDGLPLGQIGSPSGSVGVAISDGDGTAYTIDADRRKIRKWDLRTLAPLDSIGLGTTGANNRYFEYHPEIGGLVFGDGIQFYLVVSTAPMRVMPLSSGEGNVRFRIQRPPMDGDSMVRWAQKLPVEDVFHRSSTLLRTRYDVDYNEYCGFGITGHDDGLLRIWPVGAQAPSRALQFTDRIYNVLLSPTCDLIAASGEYAYTELISTLPQVNRRIVRDVGRPDQVINFDPRGRFVTIKEAGFTKFLFLSPSLTPSAHAIVPANRAFAQGDYLLYARDERHARDKQNRTVLGVYDAQRSSIIVETSLPSEGATPLAWYPESRSLLMMTSEAISEMAFNATHETPEIKSVMNGDFSLYSPGAERSRQLLFGDWIIALFEGEVRMTQRQKGTWSQVLSAPLVGAPIEIQSVHFESMLQTIILEYSDRLVFVNSSDRPKTLLRSTQCSEYLVETAGGIFFQQIESDGCRNQLYRVDVATATRVPLIEGAIRSIEGSRRTIVVGQSDRLIVSDSRSGKAHCERADTAGNFAIYRPGMDRLTGQPNGRINGYEGTLADVQEYMRETKFQSDESLGVVIQYNARRVQVFSLLTCQKLSEWTVESENRPRSGIFRLFWPNGVPFVVTLEADQNLVVVRDLYTGRELSKVVTEGTARYGVLSDAGDIYLLQGHSAPHLMLQLPRDEMNVFASPTAALDRRVAAQIQGCPTPNCSSSSATEIIDTRENESDVENIFQPTELTGGDDTVDWHKCMAAAGLPYVWALKRHKVALRAPYRPFSIVRSAAEDCEGTLKKGRSEEVQDVLLARARIEWQSGNQKEALHQLALASEAGSSLSKCLLIQAERERGTGSAAPNDACANVRDWPLAWLHWKGGEDVSAMVREAKIKGDGIASLYLAAEQLTNCRDTAEPVAQHLLAESIEDSRAHGVDRSAELASAVLQNMALWEMRAAQISLDVARDVPNCTSFTTEQRDRFLDLFYVGTF